MTKVDALMRAYDGNVPGASLLVIKDGQSIVQCAYGLADVDANVKATPATNYRLASVTKQFTATAILRLAEEGKLSIDDSVRRWLPSLPAIADSITIRHLLTHTSGLIDYEDVMPENVTEQLLDADVLRLLETQDKTYFVPDASYRYSNSGYALLALIVERASEVTFATYLRERVFTPIGMNATVAFEKNISTVSDRAYGHTLADNTWTRTDQSSTSAVLGDGGIYSSIVDLAKWDVALYDPFYAQAFAPATATDDANIAYGFGWRISSHRDARMIWHTGETRGFRNVLLRFPEKRLTVVLLTNRNEPAPYATALKIAELFF
ncbi:MAG TPA: serine hydrolase domain-containing protein [Thermoanaerobaculia bacterium]|nr:serine hydrolase domain-containing protein [Thermoanaerobaculia bacterium]